MKHLILLLFFIISFCPYPAMNGWAFRQVLGLFLLSLVISWMLSKKYHFSVGLCFFVTTIYGLNQCGLSQFGSEVATSLMALLFYSCIALSLDESSLKFIFPLLCGVAVGDSVSMIIQRISYLSLPEGHMSANWVLVNGSLDSCFIALMAPSILFSKKNNFKIIYFSLILIAIILAKSNTGIFVLALMLLAQSILNKKYIKELLISLGLTLPPILYFLGSKFLSSTGRLNNWKTMMSFWREHANHFIGTGPGTYWVYSQWVEIHKVGDQAFTWMHNDWLQVLFEQGYIGLACVLFLFFMMLKKSFNRPSLFSVVLGYGFIALTQFPLHLFIFQLMGVALIYHCFEKKVQYGSGN